jgi:hypothetical protein
MEDARADGQARGANREDVTLYTLRHTHASALHTAATRFPVPRAGSGIPGRCIWAIART